MAEIWQFFVQILYFRQKCVEILSILMPLPCSLAVWQFTPAKLFLKPHTFIVLT